MAAAAYSDHVANVCAGPACLTKKAYPGGTMVNGYTEFTQSSALDCQQKCAALLTCNFWDWDGTSTCRLLSDDKGGAQDANGASAGRASAGQKLCAGAPDPQAGAPAPKYLCFFCETSQVHQHEPRTKRSKKKMIHFFCRCWAGYNWLFKLKHQDCDCLCWLHLPLGCVKGQLGWWCNSRRQVCN